MAAITENDRTAIRYEVRDHRENERVFSDTEIDATWTANGESVGATVIALIENAIGDIQADADIGGVRIMNRGRLRALQTLLALKRNKYRMYPSMVIDDS